MNNMFVSPVQIGKRGVGDGNPVYIMADIGLTNGGDLKRTFKLIELVAQLGVDAVKFQMIGPEVLLGDKTVEYTYETFNDGLKTENMFDMFSKLTYTEEEWIQIKTYVDKHNLEFICTAHYIDAIPLLEHLDVKVHKICTWSMTHKRLIQAMGKTGKPILLDTGAFTPNTLDRTLDWYLQAGGRGIIILHDFHSNEIDEMNFRSVPYLKCRYGFPVGYTPQGRDYDMDYLAIGLGVNVLEKRITLDRSIPENGHNKALEPDEFDQWLKRVRELERALGAFSLLPTQADLVQSKNYFKSLYSKNNIEQHRIISDEMLEARRPGTGISASQVDQVCGCRAIRFIPAGKMLTFDDLK